MMLASLYGAEIQIIQAIQVFHFAALDSVMNAISFLGEDLSYMILIIWLWSSRSPKLVARIAVLLFLSFFLNSFLKDLFEQPRPFQYGKVLQLGKADGYGIPSGHAQSSLLFWGMAAVSYPTPRLSRVATALVLLIGFSRVYLGVHFPTDVLGGWLVAGVLMIGTFRFGGRIERFLGSLPAPVPLVLAALLCSGLFSLHSTETAAASLGAFFGLASGLAGFGLQRVRKEGALNRFVQTAVGAAFLYIALHKALPGKGEDGYLAFRFVRYALLSFWVSGLSPWLSNRAHPAPVPAPPRFKTKPRLETERMPPSRPKPIEIPGITRTKKRKPRPTV